MHRRVIILLVLLLIFLGTTAEGCDGNGPIEREHSGKVIAIVTPELVSVVDLDNGTVHGVRMDFLVPVGTCISFTYGQVFLGVIPCRH